MNLPTIQMISKPPQLWGGVGASYGMQQHVEVGEC